MLRIASAVHFFFSLATKHQQNLALRTIRIILFSFVNYEQHQQSPQFHCNFPFQTPTKCCSFFVCVCIVCRTILMHASARLSPSSSAFISAHARRIFAHFVRPKCKLWTSFAFRAKRKCLFYAKNELIRRGRGRETMEQIPTSGTHTLSQCEHALHVNCGRNETMICAFFASPFCWDGQCDGDQHLLGEKCE